MICLSETIKQNKKSKFKTWIEPKKKKNYPQRSHSSANSPVRRRQPFLVFSTNSLQLLLKQTFPEAAADDDISEFTKLTHKKKKHLQTVWIKPNKKKKERKGKVFLVQQGKFSLEIAKERKVKTETLERWTNSRERKWSDGVIDKF